VWAAGIRIVLLKVSAFQQLLLQSHHRARCGWVCLGVWAVGIRVVLLKVSAFQQLLLQSHHRARCGGECLGVWAAGIRVVLRKSFCFPVAAYATPSWDEVWLGMFGCVGDLGLDLL